MKPKADEINEWIKEMQIVLSGIEVGQKYIIRDGKIIPANQKNIKFEGWSARHKNQLPQMIAKENFEVIQEQLSNNEY